MELVPFENQSLPLSLLVSGYHHNSTTEIALPPELLLSANIEQSIVNAICVVLGGTRHL